MRKNISIAVILLLICYFKSFAQTNEIRIDAQFFPITKQIKIEQEINYFNNSKNNLDTIYLHNWSNAYKDRHTPLSNRLIENYDKSLYFAKIDKRGYSNIQSVTIDNQTAKWEELDYAVDIVKIILNKPLKPTDSLVIKANYIIKIPIDKFTSYGYKLDNFNLRYWYMTPAVYDDKWKIMSNLNLDDIYMDPSNYKINFKIPLGYRLHTDLQEEVEIMSDHILFHLEGKNRVDIELNVQLQNNFSIYKTDSLEIISNLKSKNLTNFPMPNR